MELQRRDGTDRVVEVHEGELVCALLGLPGAGKGTQAAVAASRLDLIHVSTGELARAVPTSDRRFPDLSRRLRQGRLLPDELVFDLIFEHLRPRRRASGLLFDGFPRNLRQAHMLERSIPVDLVVHIDVPAAVAQQRLEHRSRLDDHGDAVALRLRKYEHESRPLLEWYRARGQLRHVDGDRAPDEVAADVVAMLGAA